MKKKIFIVAFLVTLCFFVKYSSNENTVLNAKKIDSNESVLSSTYITDDETHLGIITEKSLLISEKSGKTI
ncbi:hypothetical protein [Haploplasma axanthum]|nr:hypothetical protein [Haploplasma axanthum]